MEREIRRVTFTHTVPSRLKRVAAYTRVSSDKYSMLHSLSAQISYYNELIQKNPEWQFAGVYTDAGITGTKAVRPGFQNMLNDCRAGRIDMIYTKSISRFARNTLVLLETVRELKGLGIDVYFEKENLHSISSDGELMLSILASFAQEESLSASQNQLWRVQKNYREGKPWNCTMLGYRYEAGQFKIVPEEARVVRDIFGMYLDGNGLRVIARRLNEEGLCGRHGHPWQESAVLCVLKNYTYTGNLLLQQTYSENHITKKRHPNKGQYPKYHVEDAHEAIIPMEMFQAVQEEMMRRAQKSAPSVERRKSPFAGMLVCEKCGKHYYRRQNHAAYFWSCSTAKKMGKAYCAAKMVPEKQLIQLVEELIGDVGELSNQMERILVCSENRLIFRLRSGMEIERVWKERSRAESWTPEMKKTASEMAKKKLNPNQGADGRFLAKEVM